MPPEIPFSEEATLVLGTAYDLNMFSDYFKDLPLWENYRVKSNTMQKLTPKKDYSSWSKAELENEIKTLSVLLSDASHNLTAWKARCARYENTLNEYSELLTKAKKNISQADIRRVVNRVLKVHNLDPLGIPRDVPKEVFLSSLSNHLNNMLSKDVPNDELAN